ncbi:hypothetical protein D3C81_1561440 [compost metagenome]
MIGCSVVWIIGEKIETKIPVTAVLLFGEQCIERCAVIDPCGTVVIADTGTRLVTASCTEEPQMVALQRIGPRGAEIEIDTAAIFELDILLQRTVVEILQGPVGVGFGDESCRIGIRFEAIGIFKKVAGCMHPLSFRCKSTFTVTDAVCTDRRYYGMCVVYEPCIKNIVSLQQTLGLKTVEAV